MRPVQNFIQHRPLTALISLLVLLGGLYGLRMVASMGGGGGPGEGGMKVAVEAAPVVQAPLVRQVTAVGSLVAQDGIILRPEISGRVDAILFIEGEAVSKDKPLIRLDDSVYRAQLTQAQAELAVAERNLNRAQALVGRGAGTEATRDEAAARQRTAEAAVRLAQANLDKTLIVAPFSGTIGLRQVNVGDFVSPGQTLVSLQSLEMLKVDFNVPENLLGGLKTGLPVSVTVTAYPEDRFKGEVSAIDPLVDPATRSVALRALIPNTENKLRPGLFASVSMTLSTDSDRLFVPSGAIWPMGTQQNVFVIRDEKTALVPVTILHREADRVAVQGDLTAHEQVVTAGHAKIMMFGQGNPVDVLITNAPSAPKPESEPASGESKAPESAPAPTPSKAD